MSDRISSKAVHAVHSMLVMTIVVTFFICSLLFFWLTNGIDVAKVSTLDFKIEQLYIKWDKGLILHIDSIDLYEDNSSSSEVVNIDTVVNRLATALKYSDELIFEIKIDNIRAGDLNATLYFSPNHKSVLMLNTDEIEIELNLEQMEREEYEVILMARSDSFDTTFDANGTLYADEKELVLNGLIEVSDDIYLQLDIELDSDMAKFSALSLKSASSTTSIASQLPLDEEIVEWFDSRIIKANIDLLLLSGSVEYERVDDFLNTLEAKLILRDVEYNFADGFESAYSKRVDISFDNSKLHIVPQQAEFYEQQVDDLDIVIDFAKESVEMSLDLESDIVLDDNIHRLIEFYGVDLPMRQSAGLTKSKLRLDLNLQTLDVEAKGRFVIESGALDFGGLRVDVEGVDVKLENTLVHIYAEEASIFEHNVSGSISGYIDPAKESGALDFSIYRAQHYFGSSLLELDDESVKLKYLFDKNGDTVHLDRSNWIFENRSLVFESFKAPMDLNTLVLQLPPTELTYDHNTTLKLDGVIALEKPTFSLNAEVINLDIAGFRSGTKRSRLKLLLDDNLSIESAEQTEWVLEDVDIVFEPFVAVVDERGLHVDPIKMRAGGFLDATVQTDIEFKTNSTKLEITDFLFTNETLGELFSRQKSIKMFIVPDENGNYEAIAPSLHMSYKAVDSGWQIHFYTLDALYDSSKLMRQYSLSQGSFTIYSKESDDSPFRFSGVVDYPYALTLKDGNSIWNYKFDGTFSDDKHIELAINDKIAVSIKDEINITTQSIDFNMPEMVRFYEDHESSDGNGSSIGVNLKAYDSAIFFDKERKAISDKITLSYSSDAIVAQLLKEDGRVDLEVDGAQFYLRGKALNDDFMDSIFVLSDFSGGELSFLISGTTSKFSGLVRVDETTVYDFIILNNIFAFFNTIPALITFSSPSYERDGIYVESSYAKIEFEDKNLTVSDIEVRAKEMRFTGGGYIDYGSDYMKLELAVEIKAAENLRKIPLIGYILAGDDGSELTTVQVIGDIENPRIGSLIAKDMIVTPFNILLRTISFPIHYIKKFQEQ